MVEWVGTVVRLLLFVSAFEPHGLPLALLGARAHLRLRTPNRTMTHCVRAPALHRCCQSELKHFQIDYEEIAKDRKEKIVEKAKDDKRRKEKELAKEQREKEERQAFKRQRLRELRRLRDQGKLDKVCVAGHTWDAAMTAEAKLDCRLT